MMMSRIERMLYAKFSSSIISAGYLQKESDSSSDSSHF